MKRKSWYYLLSAVICAVICAVAIMAWLGSAKPRIIPYDAWSVRERHSFPLSNVTDDSSPPKIRRADIQESSDFLFTIGVGSGMFGLDIFGVSSSGKASFIFSTAPDEWWKAEFEVAPAHITRLRQLLVEVDYPSLKRAYHADVVDGTQWCMRLDVAGVAKHVYCDNHFPEPARRLARLVGSEILPAHEATIKKARRIGAESARRASDVLW